MITKQKIKKISLYHLHLISLLTTYQWCLNKIDKDFSNSILICHHISSWLTNKKLLFLRRKQSNLIKKLTRSHKEKVKQKKLWNFRKISKCGHFGKSKQHIKLQKLNHSQILTSLIILADLYFDFNLFFFVKQIKKIDLKLLLTCFFLFIWMKQKIFNYNYLWANQSLFFFCFLPAFKIWFVMIPLVYNNWNW